MCVVPHTRKGASWVVPARLVKRSSSRQSSRLSALKAEQQGRLDHEPTRASQHSQNDLEFSRIYGVWHAKVRRWVSSLGAPAGDVDDVTQDVFVIVRRKLADFHAGNMAGWLFRITERTVRDFRRRARFRREWQYGSIEQAATVSTEEEPGRLYETREKLRRIEDLLSHMSTKRRETFMQFAVQGFSGEEIARLHHVPIATVWSRIHQARKELTGSMSIESRAAAARRRGEKDSS